jgi:hypothetical protein
MSCVDGVCKIGGEYAGNKVRCEGVRSKDGNCFCGIETENGSCETISNRRKCNDLLNEVCCWKGMKYQGYLLLVWNM